MHCTCNYGWYKFKLILPLHCISLPVHEPLLSSQSVVDPKHTLYRVGRANEGQDRGEDFA